MTFFDISGNDGHGLRNYDKGKKESPTKMEVEARCHRKLLQLRIKDEEDFHFTPIRCSTPIDLEVVKIKKKKSVSWKRRIVEDKTRRIKRATGFITHQTMHYLFVAFFDDESFGKTHAAIAYDDAVWSNGRDVSPENYGVYKHRKVHFDAEKLTDPLLLDNHFCKYLGSKVVIETGSSYSYKELLLE